MVCIKFQHFMRFFTEKSHRSTVFHFFPMQMHELSDAQLPKLPLTDKAKRKLERQKKSKKLEKLGNPQSFPATGRCEFWTWTEVGNQTQKQAGGKIGQKCSENWGVVKEVQKCNWIFFIFGILTVFRWDCVFLQANIEPLPFTCLLSKYLFLKTY